MNTTEDGYEIVIGLHVWLESPHTGEFVECEVIEQSDDSLCGYVYFAKDIKTGLVYTCKNNMGFANYENVSEV